MRIIVFVWWLFAYCRQFTLYYQFPFAVQTYAFLRSICRHSHFVRNHTKTVTFKYNITHSSWDFFKFVCFCSVSFALQKRHYLQWFRALEENHTFCNNLSCLWLAGWVLFGWGGVAGLGWLGWAGWVGWRAVWLPDHLHYILHGSVFVGCCSNSAVPSL